MLSDLKKVLGKEKFERLAQARIGIGGLGGLGSNVAAHLVRSGIRYLVLVDFDIVDMSNLNRQFYFRDQVGISKVQALTANLSRIQPEVEIMPFDVRVTQENLFSIFGSCDIWVEAFDSPEMKQLFVEEGMRLNKHVVSASGIAGWGSTDAILTYEWRSGFVVIGDLSSAAGPSRPVLSPRVGVAAAKEADVVLRWILGEE